MLNCSKHPMSKLCQAEKVRHNKQISPARIDIITRVPHNNRDYLGAPSPFPPTFLNTLWFYRLQSLSKHISALIDVMSNTSDIELQFKELPCMHSILKY